MPSAPPCHASSHGSTAAPTTPPVLWLYLHFPLLPLEMLYSEESPGATALLDERQARLWLCNPQARAEGLRPGMAIATAGSLCPGVTLLSRQPQREPQQLQSLALWAARFSAQISLQPSDGLLLEIGSMLDYFRGFELFQQCLQQQLSELAFSSQIATGNTPLMARLLARNGGFIGHTRAQHLEQSGSLPVSALELDGKTTERLIGMGLTQLQQLLTLPRNELASRLGPELLTRIDRLTGQHADPPRYFTPPQRFSQRLELLHEVDTSTALLFPLRRLLAALAGYLHRRQLQAEQLHLALRQRPHADAAAPEQTISLKHSAGEHRAEAWLELWRLRLERLTLQQPVIALRLTACHFRQRQDHHQELFAQPLMRSDGGADSAPQLTPEQLLSRLQTRLGDTAIDRLGLAADHRPERSWQRLPADQPLPATDDPLAAGQPGRPNWLLEPPQPLPGQQVGAQIQLLKGPERIVSGWWDGAPVRRDYYTGRWPDGRLGWLYRDDRGGWYVHGWFG